MKNFNLFYVGSLVAGFLATGAYMMHTRGQKTITPQEVDNSVRDQFAELYEGREGTDCIEHHGGIIFDTPYEYNNRHAILINANVPPKSVRHINDFVDVPFSSEIFRNNVEHAYISLLNSGFTPDSVHVLQSYSFGPYVDGAASSDVLEDTVAVLAEKSTKDDLVVVYVSSHGTQFRGDTASYMSLEDKFMRDSDFSNLIAKIPSKTTIGVFTQCAGGGFGEEFAKRDMVGVSASGPTYVAYVSNAHIDFSESFFSAFSGEFSIDYTGEGSITLDEVFHTAVSQSGEKQHSTPHLYSSSQDPSLITLHSTSSTITIERPECIRERFYASTP